MLKDNVLSREKMILGKEKVNQTFEKKNCLQLDLIYFDSRNINLRDYINYTAGQGLNNVEFKMYNLNTKLHQNILFSFMSWLDFTHPRPYSI